MGKRIILGEKIKSYKQRESNYPQKYSQNKKNNHIFLSMRQWVVEIGDRRLIKEKLIKHRMIDLVMRVKSTYLHRLLIPLLSY
jgi:deoxyhypusine synthase